MGSPTLAKRATYEFNVRSFHPEPDFGWTGLHYSGDDRGFSNEPSSLTETGVTSRIWQRFQFDTGTNNYSELRTESNDSHAAGAPEAFVYDDEWEKPWGDVTLFPGMPVHPKPNLSHFRFKAEYGGVNHAVQENGWHGGALGSSSFQKHLGISYVPTLDVSYEVWMDVDQANSHVDVVIYVKGDGFPNCEAFIVDPSGNSVFLGTHVRVGTPVTNLWGDMKRPMITAAVRLPIDAEGNFTGMIGNEWARQELGQPNLTFESIPEWNERFLRMDPNTGHNMCLENFCTPAFIEKMRNSVRGIRDTANEINDVIEDANRTYNDLKNFYNGIPRLR